MHAARTLRVGGPCAGRELELDAAALAAVPAEHQVPDVGALVRGRAGRAVRMSALIELARPSAEARFVHVASEVGGFTANLDLERARAGLLLLYAEGDGPLPAAHGGPFRLLFADDSADCSVNVKFLAEVQFVREPGSHTARCASEPGPPS